MVTMLIHKNICIIKNKTNYIYIWFVLFLIIEENIIREKNIFLRLFVKNTYIHKIICVFIDRLRFNKHFGFYIIKNSINLL